MRPDDRFLYLFFAAILFFVAIFLLFFTDINTAKDQARGRPPYREEYHLAISHRP